MTYRRLISVALLVVFAAPLIAQQQPIAHDPLTCIQARKHGVVFGTSDAKGEARLYYRRAGATEWCYVDGMRILNRIRAILPEFEPEAEIEHFFVLVNNGEVTARSAKIYKVKALNQCGTLVARGVEFMLNTCEDQPGQLGSAVAAGYALTGDPELPPVTPFLPE